MRLSILTFTILQSVAVVTLLADDWPHWRGPLRNGQSGESSRWEEGAWENLTPTWTANVGEGSSSPVVVNDRLYMLGWANDEESLTCLNCQTGEVIWKKSYPAPRYGRKANGDKGLYSGPTSTPEFDVETGLIYSLGTDGDLRCWNTRKDGQGVWEINLYDNYEVPQRPKVGRSGLRDYGYTTSPLVLPDVVVVEVGATTGTLIGFHKLTGKEVWRSQVCDPPGHTGGPIPITIDGAPCVAVHNFAGLLVVRVDGEHAGETVCQIPWNTDFANNIATPAVWNNNIILTSSYNQHRIARYRLSLNADPEMIWEREEASKVCSPVIQKGFVYWAWRQVHCLDFETGQTIWNGGPLGDAGSFIYTSDDRLILWANRGDLRLVDTAVRSPDKYSQLAEQKILNKKDAWPHVVLSNGWLYCKDRTGQIAALQLKPQ